MLIFGITDSTLSYSAQRTAGAPPPEAKERLVELEQAFGLGSQVWAESRLGGRLRAGRESWGLAYIYIYIYTHVYVYTYVYMYLSIYIYIHIQMDLCTQNIYIYIRT